MPVAQTRLEILQVCKLLQCVRNGDRKQIEKLTLHGIPHLINYNDPTLGDTALCLAAEDNNVEMLAFLLELGAHPDVVDFKGRTPIMRAAHYGHTQCMIALADVGASMAPRDLEGKGVINYCLTPTERHRLCLDIALQNGADVNNIHNNGMPEIVAACNTAADNEDMCMKLIINKADVCAVNNVTGRTALMAACASGSTLVVRALLDRGANDVINLVQSRPKYTAAHEAAKAGHFEVLLILAAYSVKMDVYDEMLNNPIHLAAKSGHDLCCKFLGQRGCNPKAKNADGALPKALAKENGHKAAIKQLKKVEKSFGKKGKHNDPRSIALYDFCYARHDQLKETFESYDADTLGVLPQSEFTEYLTNLGAPMPADSDWKTIMHAHSRDRHSVVDYNAFLGGKKWVNKQFLMSAFEGKKKKKKKKGGKGKKGSTKILMPICTHADGPRQNDGGPPDVFQPRHIHYTDTARFDRDRPPDHPLQDDSGWYLHHPEKSYVNINVASKHKDIETLKDAFARGMDVNMRDKYYKTPLMIAAVHGRMDMVKFLMDNGALVNAEDNFKWTPLHFACHAGILDVVMYLLENGANLEAKALNKSTPIMRAIESSKPEVVQYLIDKGAKVQIQNRKGQNPVDVAAAWADPRVLDIVKTKYDSLPIPKDKKKGAKMGGGKSTPVGDKHAGAAGGGHQTDAAGVTGESIPPPRQRKGSILRAASALAGGIDEVEDITFTPIKVWTKQPNTKELLAERVVRRERYSWEVDFPDFKMPFLKNVANKMEEQGGFDEVV